MSCYRILKSACAFAQSSLCVHFIWFVIFCSRHMFKHFSSDASHQFPVSTRKNCVLFLFSFDTSHIISHWTWTGFFWGGKTKKLMNLWRILPHTHGKNVYVLQNSNDAFFFDFHSVHCIFTIRVILIVQNEFTSFCKVDVKSCVQQLTFLVF